MIWQISFGDGRGGAYRVELTAEPQDPLIPGSTSDTVRVARRYAGATAWVPVERIVELRPDEEATIY